jgi:hypothetical protein
MKSESKLFACILRKIIRHKKQTGRPMDQNRRSRHKPMHLYSTDLQQRSPKTHNGGKTASSTNVAGKTGYSHVED